MTVASTAAPAASRQHRRAVASSVIALVVLIGCGVMGVATSFGPADGQHRDVVTADVSGRLSPDAVHSGLRTQPNAAARRLGHRMPDSGASQSRGPGPGHSPSVVAGAPDASPVSRSGSSPTRGPPLLIL
jgi:hypothetical protein